ncbi:Pre-mRNA-splicing factor SPF27 [Anthophora quadrimaculata]
MAGEVVVDALPYIDQGYDEPGVREAALAMVEEETRRYRPTKNYLEHLPPLNITAFETEVMKHEFERMQNRLPMEVLSMKRYELPPPPPGKMNDLAAWNESVENSSAQLEHQATRICNLELMMEYGCEAWKSYLEILVQLVSQAQKQLQALRKKIQEVNWQRKSMQTQGGEKLRALEAQWVGLVSKNYEIEQACVHLEEEIQKSILNKGEGVEISDVPGEEEPDVPGKSATEVMATEMDQQEQENQEA